MAGVVPVSGIEHVPIEPLNPSQRRQLAAQHAPLEVRVWAEIGPWIPTYDFRFGLGIDATALRHELEQPPS